MVVAIWSNLRGLKVARRMMKSKYTDANSLVKFDGCIIITHKVAVSVLQNKTLIDANVSQFSNF